MPDFILEDYYALRNNLNRKELRCMGLKDLWKNITTIDVEVAREIQEEDVIKRKTQTQDNLISLAIFELKKKMSTYSPFQMTEDDIEAVEVADKDRADKYTLLEKASQDEKSDLPEAIKIYEQFVENGWNVTTTPYDRLAIIYRKNKQYDDEIRVLKSGVIMMAQHEFFTDATMSYRLLDRLEKAIILRGKSNV